MKKFITAIVSLVLAGTMTAGLAACGGNGGGNSGNGGGGNGGGNGGTEQTEEEKWAAMVDGLKTLDNFTATDSETGSMGIKYSGEYVNEDTVYSEDETEQMMKQMFVSMLMQQMGDIGLDEKNPAEFSESSVYKADYKNGKFAKTSYVDENKFNYAIADANGVKLYDWGTYYSSDEEEHTGYYLEQYVGYASAAQAREALKTNSNPLTNMFKAEFTGVGENADKTGTIPELYELFTFDSAKSAYVGQLAMPSIPDFPLPLPDDTVVVVDMEIKISNQAVVGYKMDFELDLSLADLMGGMMTVDEDEGETPDMSAMLEGFTVGMAVSNDFTISDIDVTVVNIPADIDEQVYVDEYENRYEYTYYVISDEDAYKAMFEGLLGNKDTICLSISNYPDNYTAYYNGELGLLKVVEENRETYEKSATVYWATNNELKIYTANYDGGSFDSWSEPETEAISGEAAEALLSKLPAEMQLYFNLNGKHLSEQFDIFEVSYYNYYSAEISFNDKEYELSISYNYSESKEKLYFNQYRLREVGADDDVYVYVRQGNMEYDDGLPDSENESVTEIIWKSLVEPWYDLKNITITNDNEQTVIDIAADGSSGKIYYTSYNFADSWYIVFEKVGENYTMTKYSFNVTEYDYQNGNHSGFWMKKVYEDISYDDILNEANLYLLSNINGLGDMWEDVEYNPMSNTYEILDYGISIRFVDGKLIYGSNTFANKGTTVAGELPAELDDAIDFVGRYEFDLGATGKYVLILNRDGTFTLDGFENRDTIEGNWSFDFGNFYFNSSTANIEFASYNAQEQTIALYVNVSDTLFLTKVEA